jgi:hypothetical protein
VPTKKVRKGDHTKMKASTIIDDTMTLDQKLAAIDAAMAAAQSQANDDAQKRGLFAAPLDPADLTMCEGCQ